MLAMSKCKAAYPDQAWESQFCAGELSCWAGRVIGLGACGGRGAEGWPAVTSSSQCLQQHSMVQGPMPAVCLCYKFRGW